MGMQVEEAYIGADQFCSLVRQESQSVLRNELNVLHGLKFDLITHLPLRALDGLFQVCLHGLKHKWSCWHDNKGLTDIVQV